MFERYTEKARRAIFFARYEASQFGLEFIATEHLLLGILRDNKELVRELLPEVGFETVRAEIEKRGIPDKSIPVSVDLPLSEDAKDALKSAAEEAERLQSRHIGTEHLLLALMRDKDFSSAQLLAKFLANLESLRKRVEALPPHPDAVPPAGGPNRVIDSVRQYRESVLRALTVEIHGKKRNSEELRNVVVRLKSENFYWERKLWQARDVVYEKNGKRFSFDTTLAKDEGKFILVAGGWKRESCAICQWELFLADDAAHGTGYTNGKEWVCEECYWRFIAANYLGSAYSDIT
jgi:hypothetical protein